MDILNQPGCIMKWTLGRGKLLSHVGCANNRIIIAALVRIGNSIFVHAFFLFITLIIAFMTMILVYKCFFVNNYSVFALSAIDMAFRGLHDANPSYPYVLVL